MASATEREKDFRKDWEELLERHKAEAEYDIEDGSFTITMWSRFDDEHNQTDDFAEFTL